MQALYAKGGELATAAVAAQTQKNISPVAGHQILSSISSAQMMVSSALGHMADGHRQLEALGRRLGIDVSSFGDVLKPPQSVVVPAVLEPAARRA
ncbi:hypothetical protein [Novosphingobium album (ex Liu et al. 2023)]|uniref:Uncharacterized protein n=1 Tax=Novosphingobium album (ex Liu et al. 2023) TaxID=3031130 RepID=A0ABT5WSP0_9SPHN|nr:hypothetical protein [Novosphingobium album (ex Liu et al. 2023)]MDE8652257.1 hypothetical protein [Novosphingobium album (ex Liu et al. 2023)]